MNSLNKWTLAYARHIHLDTPQEAILKELRLRASSIARWAQYLCELSAWFLFYLSPLFLLGQMKTFGQLDSADQERLLYQLQNNPRLIVKKIFFSVKSLTLAACYGHVLHAQKIGYDDPRI